jgi:hypothetical protein
MNRIFRSLLNSLQLVPKAEYEELRKKLSIWKTTFVPPGHYYSPLNDVGALAKDEQKYFEKSEPIRDIDLNEEGQKKLLKELRAFYDLSFFSEHPSKEHRYHLDNTFYSYSDGIFLYCLLNYLKPSKVIEVGSGFSSALMLDVNEKKLNHSMKLTFIEPYPEERLLKLLRPSDEKQSKVIKNFVQEVDENLFKTLVPNDILFIDSSHVSKFNSDLNFILFQILPTLNSGVYIHFHDVFFPFEYPKEWILSGRAWNEIYLLRAFLMNNKDYEIVLFPSMMEHYEKEWLERQMPETMKLHEKWPSEKDFKYYLPNKGQSIWLRKK